MAAERAQSLSIIIVHHGTPDLLATCLRSIADTPIAVRHEVLVIDNASEPPLPADFEARWPSFRLIRNRQNIGYSRAVNQGVRLAAGDLLLILNPDIEVRGDAIGEMVRFLDATPRAGIVGCRLLNADGTLQYSCRTFYDWKTLLWRRTPLGRLFPRSGIVRRHLMADWDHASVREVDWLIGACLLVRREAIENVGLMDERFFMYFEDVDWCYRMGKAGYKVYYIPNAEMMHRHRRDSTSVLDRRFIVHLLSMLRYADKWNSVLWNLRRRREAFAGTVTLFIDLAAANLAFLVAFASRNALSALFVKPVFPVAAYTPFVLFMNGILAVTFAAMGLYGNRVRSRGAEAVGPILRGSFVAYLILTLATFLSREIIYSRLVILAFLPLEVAFVLFFREGLRRVERVLRRHAFDLRRVAIVGRGPDAERVRAALEADPDLRYEIAGFTGEGPGSLGRFADLPRRLEAQRLHEVVLADPAIGRDEIETFLLAFRRLPVQVTVAVAGQLAGAHHGHIAELGEDPVLVYDRGTRFGIRPGPKRAFDCVIALPLAVFLLPLLFLRPLLYTSRQKEGGASGFWARLPRIYSVLRGSLSFVGIPPERVAEAEGAAGEIPMGLVPFWLWARGDRPERREQWERLAHGYRLRWSPTLDLSILLKALLMGGGR